MHSERVPIRRSFFAPLFSKLRELLPEVYSSAVFDEHDADCLIELFFLLSDAYKEQRVERGHLTNDYKKAGITIAAVMALRPIRLPDPENNTRAYYANPIFGMACATAILRLPPVSMPLEEKEQFYHWLDNCRFPSIGRFLELAATGAVPDIEISLSPAEIALIDMIIKHITDLCRLHDVDSQLYDFEEDP